MSSWKDRAIRCGLVVLAIGFALVLLRAASTPVAFASIVGPQHSPAVLHWIAADQIPTETAEPRMDRFGNEIDDAIGDYRIDTHGNVYESHSPETAISILGPPQS